MCFSVSVNQPEVVRSFRLVRESGIKQREAVSHLALEGMGSAVIRELQVHIQVLGLEHGDDGLQVVALFRAHAQFITLNLCLDTLGSFFANELGDLLRVFLVDAFFDCSFQALLLTGRIRFTRVQ